MDLYTIREIKLRELDDLMLLIEEHTAFEKADYNSDGKKDRLGIELFKEQHRLNCWVVEIDGAVNGFCTYTVDFSTWDAATYLHMDCLYIREKYRGLGIGFAILKKLTLVAIKNGCINLQWQTPVFNTAAIAFYKKTGAIAKEKMRFSLSII